MIHHHHHHQQQQQQQHTHYHQSPIYLYEYTPHALKKTKSVKLAQRWTLDIQQDIRFHNVELQYSANIQYGMDKQRISSWNIELADIQQDIEKRRMSNWNIKATLPHIVA